MKIEQLKKYRSETFLGMNGFISTAFALYFLSLPLVQIVTHSRTSLVDEILIYSLFIFSLLWATLFNLKIKLGIIPIILSLYMLYLIFLTFSSWASDVSGIPLQKAWLFSVITESKIAALIIMMAFANIHVSRVGNVIGNCFIILSYINIPFAIFDIIFRDVNIYGIPLERLGNFHLPTGIFWGRFDSAQIALLAFIATLAKMHKHAASGTLVLSVVILSIYLLVHVSVKETFAWVVILIVFFMRTMNLNKMFFMMFAFSMMPFVFMTSITENALERFVFKIENFNISSSDFTNLRQASYAVSLDVAQNHFPFGSGGGTFLSEPSRSMGYSSVYDDTKLSYVHGATRENSTFLLDIFWPRILGESGLFGMMFYILFYFIPLFLSIRAFIRQDLSYDSSFRVYVLVGSLVVSVADSTFTGPIFPIPVALCIYSACTMSRFERRST